MVDAREPAFKPSVLPLDRVVDDAAAAIVCDDAFSQIQTTIGFEVEDMRRIFADDQLRELHRLHVHEAMSIKALAERFDVSRSAISRGFGRLGLSWRSRSDAELIKWRAMDIGARRRQVAAANAAIRGRPANQERLMRAAVSRQASLVKIGRLEVDLAGRLARCGFPNILQLAVGRYNLDIGLAPVAVEIQNATCAPLLVPRLRKRCEYLADAGWNTIYLMTGRGIVIERPCLEKLVAFAKRSKRDPTFRRQHWVIGGAGKLRAVCQYDGHEWTSIKTLEGFPDHWSDDLG